MSGTEGLGGPCPRCGEMNCYIKKGSGTWYTFIACPSCYFAYGENADNMQEQTGGVIGGAEVWQSLIYARDINSLDEIHGWLEEDKQFTTDSPFRFSDDEEHWLNTCVVSEEVLDGLVSAYSELKH